MWPQTTSYYKEEHKVKKEGSYLFPLGNEVTISIALVQAELVELFRYLLPAVIKVINIATPLMREFEDWPQGFTLSLAIMFIHLSCTKEEVTS